MARSPDVFVDVITVTFMPLCKQGASTGVFTHCCGKRYYAASAGY
jgi:hypothetical protein